MISISMICTIHEECGYANSLELSAWLENLKPEVIFLEVPNEAFDDFFNTCIRENLESVSVRKFQEHNNVKLVPIDLPTPKASFFEDYQYLVNRVEGVSSEFRKLRLWDINYARDHGFAYLNSEHCNKMWSEINDEELATIQKLNEPRLTEIYEFWSETNNLRENEMLRKIKEYCSGHAFERGVFLIGCAHRRSIIEKLNKTSDESTNVIQWNFDGIDKLPDAGK